ncbi:hypothetical protein A3B18_01035 [Candidatus Giovannonibacteria bacterium RIFCSPLOWO2_01_FULL_46_13]|uniref:2'-deoxycytidine 5'-triphosphate deaminase n=1 Tax=Candidatus Giovannonibacteria bacterium RIFCSPLOWO2_01_FULL_46_13 TaxID=1798352 RepID=A0A1F5X2Y3_9BACT|nr:MAG: hypothetical protein A3B18_01035 [Candidatus Giovannonibacteria bacterium RIFCSPLOWO2_01_FULL_46_13]
MKKLGAIPSQTIRDMMAASFIKGADEKNIQPASLDLSISEQVYRVSSAFTPKTGEGVFEAAKRLADPEPHDFSKPLELDTTYLVKLNESLALPEGIYAYANPKSTSGRNDIHARLLGDGMQRFDSAGVPGFKGDLWSLITPHSFRIKMQTGDTLSQMRFFNSDTRIESEPELEINYQRHKFLYNVEGNFIDYSKIKIRDRDGSLILTINLDSDLVGYRCEKSQEILDLSRRDHDPDKFFTPIYRPKDGKLKLRKGDFYIFFTKQCPRVPPTFSAELAPVDVRAGEYRSHYAGFIDPGWGHGRDGNEKGWAIVLELRPYEDNLILEDNKPICKLVYERVTEEPELVYGEGTLGSNYALQNGPRLSKHFKS